MKTDIKVENEGSLFLLRWFTKRGHAWLMAHTARGERQTWGNALVVEPRYVQAIVVGAREAGLEVN